MRRRSSSARLATAGIVWAVVAHAGAEEPGATCEPGAEPASAEVASAPTSFALANQARAAIDAGRLEGAEGGLEAALAGGKPAGRQRVRVLLHVGRSYAQLASATQTTDPARASAARRRAAELLNAAADMSRDRDERLHSFALGYLGALYETRDRTDEALTLTRRALLAADRAAAPDALYRWHWQMGRLLRARGEHDASLAAYRRSVAQLDLLRAELASISADAALAFRAEVEPVYVELVDLLLREAAANGRGADQPLLAEARDTLEALKAAELRNHFRDACLDAQRKTTPEAVPGALVLYPVVLPDRVELILSSDAGLSRHASSVDGATLDREADLLRRLLPKRTTRQFLAPAQKLYEWLIRPVEPALASRSVTAFVVVPSGSLRSIPFAALHDAKSGQFLIEKLPVAVTPGLTLTDPRPIDRARARGLVAGVSEAVQGFPPLENVPAELEHVSESFPGVALLNREFVVARFEGEVKANPVSVVHVASHGEFNADADKSFVLAYDEKIPMDRLASIVGSTRLRIEEPLELLVLSACQTAAGDDRAALGLAGVALRSGARSALATLWSVNDEAAAELITRFYRELASGSSRARALQQAQLQMLAQPAFRHPAYWSPFLLISSWL